MANAGIARAETVAGVTDGALSVDKLGAAVYTAPIAVPPGVAGMEPALSLNYSSRAGNNIMGLGWSIGGLSVIHRCAKSIAQDGSRGAINFDAEDRFCLDGQRLVVVSGTYGADGAEYRTEIDAFARITSQGTAGTGPESFTVENKAGQILKYGATADSRLEVQNGATVRLWSLNRVEDRVGNYMTLHYQKGAADQSYRIERIEYAGNVAANTTPQSEVRFLYEPRPDPRDSYQAGTRIDLLDRLTEIEAHTDGALVREYRLVYDTSPSTGRSRLRSITECAANGDCFAPLQFTWTESGGLTFTETRNPIPHLDASHQWELYFTDLNSDGIADISAGSLGDWYLNDGAFGFTPVEPTPSSEAKVHMGDWNGDGLTDFMTVDRDATNWYINDGSTTFIRRSNLVDPTLLEDNSGVKLGDWNGDSLIDVMWHEPETGRNNWFTNNGDLTFTATQDAISQAALTSGSNVYALDWNADGITDLLWYDQDTGTTRWFINNGALGFIQYDNLLPTAAVTGGSALYFGDWNGDGVADAMWYDKASGANRWFINDGALSFSQTDDPIARSAIDGSEQIFFGDWNADGVSDLLWYDESNGANHWYLGDGKLSFTLTTNPIATSDLRRADGLYFGDWTGSGATGVLHLEFGDNLWFTNQIGSDQMVGVTDSLGRATTITYAPLTDSAVYTKGSGATFPEVDRIGPIQVVKEISSDDGVGGQARMTYAYEGLRGHAQGRGSLGFARVSAANQQTGVTSTTDYHQDFPFIGLTASSETRLADGTLVTRSTNSWVTQALNGGLTEFPFVEQSISEGFEINDGPGNSPVITTTTTMVYDAFGNPTQATATTTGAGPDGLPETFKRTARNTFDNDTTNWLLGLLRRAEVESELPDLTKETRVTALQYYSTGLPERQIVEPDRPDIALTSVFGHDVFGNLQTVTVSGPDITTRTSTTGYSPDGRFAESFTDALQHAETRGFDARFGTIGSLTGPNDITTTWSHDAFGRPLSEVRADGSETRWGYDLCVAQCPTGAVYAATQQDFATASGTPTTGKSVTFFDRLNRAFSAEGEGFDGTKVIGDRQFNARGEVVSVSKPHFAGTPAGEIQRSTATYDVLGRTRTVTLPDAAVLSTVYDGLTTTVTNPKTQVQTSTLNAIGQLVRVEDDATTTTTYSYDPFGNLEETDVNGTVTTLSHDIRGLKEYVNDPDMGLWFYEHNALGELVSRTDSKGQSVVFDYDELGRVVSRDEPEGVTTWTYDTAIKGIGKLHSVQGLDGFLEVNSYDSLGRPSQTVTTIDGENFTTGVGYDPAGRLDLITYPSGFAVRRAFNSRGYLTSVSEEGGTTVFWQADSVNAEGQLTQETLGNGVVSSFAFDSQTSFLDTIQSVKGTTQVQDLAYDFDKLGNLTGRTDFLQDREETFLYDNLNRLTASTLADLAAGGAQLASTSYAYDAVGNIQTKSDVGTYDYGEGGAGPHTLTNAGGVPYAYDTNGNMIASGNAAGSGGVSGPKVSNPATAVPGGNSELVLAGFTVPDGQDRVLLVAVSSEAASIDGATFQGLTMTPVHEVSNGPNSVALFELRDVSLGTGVATGDVIVRLGSATSGGTQATAWTLTGVDQSAAPVLAQASSSGLAETSLSGSITTSAGSSAVVSVFGLGSDGTWAPGAGESQIGYGTSAGEAAGGASHEVLAAGTHDFSWSGAAGERPTMLLAAYAATPITGQAQFAYENVQTGAERIDNYALPSGEDRVLLVAAFQKYAFGPVPEVTFAGTHLTLVATIDSIGATGLLALFHLPEALLGSGAQTGDIVVSNFTVDEPPHGLVKPPVLAFTAKGVDQTRLAEATVATKGHFRDITETLTTLTDDAAVISIFSLDEEETWPPLNPEEVQISYHVADGMALGASFENVPTAQSVTMGWAAPVPPVFSRATRHLILASYGLRPPVTGHETPTVLSPQTSTTLGSGDVTIAGYRVPSGKDRVLLVSVGTEDGTIDGVTFDGVTLTAVSSVLNGANTLSLYQLRETQIGPGSRTGDLVVQVTGAAESGLGTQVAVSTLSGVDQSATPILAQGTGPGAAEASVGTSLTTTAAQSILVSAFGLGDAAGWSPGSGQALLGYAQSGSSASGLGYALASAGSQSVNWSGTPAARPSLLLAAYTAVDAPAPGGTAGRTVAWSSFNKPSVITDLATNAEAGFTYGPGRARIKQHAVVGGLVTDTLYIGGLFERRSSFGIPDEFVHYVRAGGQTVAVRTTYDDGSSLTDKTRYLHRDHLGSVDTITGETGVVIDRLSYDPHGKRRLADWQAGTPANPDGETPRGFTGHEHLDGVELIHMNGRVYDPALGRFLSPDPFVFDPASTQGFNRYAYVHNNPLSLTDPSGFQAQSYWRHPLGSLDDFGRPWIWKKLPPRKPTAGEISQDYLNDLQSGRDVLLSDFEWSMRPGRPGQSVFDLGRHGFISTSSSLIFFAAGGSANGGYTATAVDSAGSVISSTLGVNESAEINVCIGDCAVLPSQPASAGGSFPVTAPGLSVNSGNQFSDRQGPNGQQPSRTFMPPLPPPPVNQAGIREIGRAAVQLAKHIPPQAAVLLAAALLIPIDIALRDPNRTFQTYYRVHPETGQVYSGHTSGNLGPMGNINARMSSAPHPALTEMGFGPPILDQSSRDYAAIVGREQQLIEFHGHALIHGGISANKINAIGRFDLSRGPFLARATAQFGYLLPAPLPPIVENPGPRTMSTR